MAKLKRNGYRTKTLMDVIEKATEVFRGNKDKAYQWYLEKNPLYQNLSPYEVCRLGKTAKVFKDLTKLLI